MKTTGKDLRFHSKRILDAAARGEEVIITYRGKAKAKIVPVETKSKTKGKTKSHKLFGIWKDKDKETDVAKYVRELRKGRF
jgi:prevent-host-death family protein